MGRPLGRTSHSAEAQKVAQFLVVRFLRGPVQQFDHVNFGQLHHLAQRLVHENAAAVHRRADRVRRDKQHAQALGSRLHGGEAIAEVAAERAFEGLAVGDRGECQRAAARAHGLRKLPEGPPERAEVRAQRDVAEDHGENRAGPGEEEVRHQARPFVNVLPAEQDVVLLQDGLDLLLA